MPMSLVVGAVTGVLAMTLMPAPKAQAAHATSAVDNYGITCVEEPQGSRVHPRIMTRQECAVCDQQCHARPPLFHQDPRRGWRAWY
jgi:hypothetical protein